MPSYTREVGGEPAIHPNRLKWPQTDPFGFYLCIFKFSFFVCVCIVWEGLAHDIRAQEAALPTLMGRWRGMRVAEWLGLSDAGGGGGMRARKTLVRHNPASNFRPLYQFALFPGGNFF